MQHSKDKSYEPVSEQITKEVIPNVIISVLVAMRNEEPLAIDNLSKEFEVNFTIEVILEEVTEPEVVITGNEDQSATRFIQVGQFFQDREIPFDDSILPIVPEIEDITIQNQDICSVYQAIQKPNNLISSLFLIPVSCREGEMKIGGYIDAQESPSLIES